MELRFSVRGFGCAPFLYIYGGYMSDKKVMDVSDVELTPGTPSACLGNGKHKFECCCDECDYYLLCFPDTDSKK